MNDLPARLEAEVKRLAEAASPGPWRTFRGKDGAQRLWRYEGDDFLVLAEFPIDPGRRNADEVNAKLAATFGSPDRATATVKALVALMDEIDAGWEEWTENDDRLLADTAVGRGRALLRDYAAALGVEE